MESFLIHSLTEYISYYGTKEVQTGFEHYWTLNFPKFSKIKVSFQSFIVLCLQYGDPKRQYFLIWHPVTSEKYLSSLC